jgi:hypothetical protein
MVPNVDEDPLKPSALPTPDSYKFFSAWGKKCEWKNEVTVKRYGFSKRIEPMVTDLQPPASKRFEPTFLPITSSIFPQPRC